MAALAQSGRHDQSDIWVIVYDQYSHGRSPKQERYLSSAARQFSRPIHDEYGSVNGEPEMVARSAGAASA